uniref:Uncharacterized protein n=1 Tax=Steinernema glaseri TaxID=37863 RepID=A0A1I7YW59_9BILA
MDFPLTFELPSTHPFGNSFMDSPVCANPQARRLSSLFSVLCTIASGSEILQGKTRAADHSRPKVSIANALFTSAGEVLSADLRLP